MHSLYGLFSAVFIWDVGEYNLLMGCCSAHVVLAVVENLYCLL